MFGVINYGSVFFEKTNMYITVKEFAKDGAMFLDVINSDGNRLRVYTKVSAEDFGETIIQENLDKQPLKLIESLLKNTTRIRYYKHAFSFGIEYDSKLVKNTIENLLRVISIEEMWG